MCMFSALGLVEGEEYTFRVRAKNEVGESKPVELSASVLIKAPPGRQAALASVLPIATALIFFNCLLCNQLQFLKASTSVGILILFYFYFKAPPKIEMPDEYKKGIILNAGQDIKLEIPFTGNPVPDVTWMKDNKTLKVKYF